jgi:hypothetical protein
MAVLNFIQAQKFVLSGSGTAIGDTTIILQSMVGIDAANIVTADLGTKCYGTLEPGNGTQEEAISFTGVTQNANGTATLTGVKTCLFKAPYTETSGLAKTHAGASTFILSNDAGFYNNIMTFVNTALSSGAVPATTSVNGIVTLSATPATGATPVVLSVDDPRVLTVTQANYVTNILASGAIPYVIAGGTAQALTATVSSAIYPTLSSGVMINVMTPVTVASGTTLALNSFGAKSIKKNATSTLSSGDLIASQVSQVVFDGTNWQLISPNIGTFFGLVNSGTLTKDISSTTSTVIAHGLGTIPKMVHISAAYGGASSVGMSYTQATVTGINTVSGNYAFTEGGTNAGGASGNGFVIYQQYTSTTSFLTASSITLDATNITITWSKNSTPTGTAYVSWDALA